MQHQLLTSLCGPSGCGYLRYVLLVVHIYIWLIQMVVTLFSLTVLVVLLRVVLITGLKAT